MDCPDCGRKLIKWRIHYDWRCIACDKTIEIIPELVFPPEWATNPCEHCGNAPHPFKVDGAWHCLCCGQAITTAPKLEFMEDEDDRPEE
jgi:ribosomal protein L37AE/L43A